MQQLDRSNDLLGHAGRRIGGVDMDIKLAIYGLMPLLGRGSQANTRPATAQYAYLVMRSILLISRRRKIFTGHKLRPIFSSFNQASRRIQAPSAVCSNYTSSI